MANQVAARLAGDDYQHLYAWYFVLTLLMPKECVRDVTIEDALAGSMDDVTVRHEAGTNKPDRFYQVKYHVDQRNAYSTDFLTSAEQNHTSLLEKFWNSWNLLQRQDSLRKIELHLVSNWSWDSNDKFRACIDGHDNSVTEEFFSASPGSDKGKIRKRWQEALKASDEEFQSFIKCLRFRLGHDCTQELEQRIAERMESLGLKSDSASLKIAAGIVREWIKTGKQELKRGDLEETLKEHNLYSPTDQQRCITIYMTTVKAQKFDIDPDYLLDWREYFIGDTTKKSHQLKNPADWNKRLLPHLEELEAEVNQGVNCRLIRARGLSRLSAWFAFGFTFSDVARYTIEVDQQGNHWRTDAAPSEDFGLIISNNLNSPEGEILDGEGATVAVGISITGSLEDDVREYLTHRTEKVAALLLLRPNRELSKECLSKNGDVTALADGVKTVVRTFIKKWKATRLLLFYFGPLSGACFIGHRLNAVCREIQIMEDQQPGYAPSFLLR